MTDAVRNGGDLDPLAHDYPNRPVLDARAGRYSYRVIVRGTARGRSVEEAIEIQSRTRMSAAEIILEARNTFEETNANWDSQRGTDPVLTGRIQTEGFIISATRMQPGR